MAKKLEEYQVKAIRRSLARGVKAQVLADTYSVSVTLIRKIRRYQVWRDVRP